MKQTHHYTGLTDAQVLDSREKNGSNVLTPPKKDPLWKQYLAKYEDPLIIILLIAGVLSIGISCYEFWGLHQEWTVFFEPIGIFVAIALATVLGFIFELKASKEFSVLNKTNDKDPVKVYRNNGNTIEIPKLEVVVGDIVIINTGDEIPADGILLESTTLEVDEASLTGEPVCSKTTIEAEFATNSTYPSNMVLKGTRVMAGHGIFEVTAVGDKTQNGKVFASLTGREIDEQLEEFDEIKEERELTEEENKEYVKLLAAKQGVRQGIKTPLNEQLDGLGDLITNLSYGFAALIIVGRLVHFFDWSLIAWTLAIPVVVFFWLVIKKFEDWSSKAIIGTIIGFVVLFVGMVLGMHEMLLPNQELSGLLSYTLQTLMVAVTLIVVAVPEGLPMAVTLSLAYSMESMSKTNNLVRKMHACETMGATTVICTDKTGTLTQNKMQVREFTFNKLTPELAESIAVNSTASLDFSSVQPKPVGNPTEGALLLWLHKEGYDYRNLKENSNTKNEVPFSTERKYMATTVISAITNKEVTYTKGAPEIVYAMCESSDIDETTLKETLQRYQESAYRTLGFAIDKHFVGVVAIEDPVRIDVPDAVAECRAAGIEVKIVTGDTPGTAKEIGRQINLWTANDTERNIITGPEFAALSDEELQERVMDLKIIARARPMDKKRLVEALQAKNQVVAVTGDGTNDAPALNAAHVGLSMGDGTSVAKEASDITIKDNSFSSIGRAVMWGRSLYKNIQRFLLFQLTVNVSACFIVLVGAFMGTESPLTVTQMLWVNLIMDTFGAMALASLPPSTDVMKDKPRARGEKGMGLMDHMKNGSFILNRSMLYNVLGVGFAFFLMLLGLLYIFQHADINCMSDFMSLQLGEANKVTPYEQTLLFSIFVWTHFWYMFNARSFETGKSFFSVPKSSGFWTIAFVIFIGQFIITEGLPGFFNVESFHVHGAQGWKDCGIIIVLSSIVLWIRELANLLTPSKKG